MCPHVCKTFRTGRQQSERRRVRGFSVKKVIIAMSRGNNPYHYRRSTVAYRYNTLVHNTILANLDCTWLVLSLLRVGGRETRLWRHSRIRFGTSRQLLLLLSGDGGDTAGGLRSGLPNQPVVRPVKRASQNWHRPPQSWSWSWLGRWHCQWQDHFWHNSVKKWGEQKLSSEIKCFSL